MMLNYLLIPSFAIINRIWGSDIKDGRTISIVLTALALAFFCGSPFLVCALFALGFLGVRSLGFDVFGGSLDPTSPQQIGGSFLRFFLAAIFFVLAAFFMGKEPRQALVVAAIMAGLQTVASAWYGWQAKIAKDAGTKLPWDYNIAVEMIHGALYGAGMAVLLSL